MDETELDDWFSEQKELLEGGFHAGLMAGTPVEKAKPAFDRKYRILIAKYQRRQAALERSRSRSERWRKPIGRFREWRAERIEAFGQGKARTAESIRRFFFNIKLKWLLRK